MGTQIAIKERTRPVPNTPTQTNTLRDELRHYADKLSVIERLQAFSAVPHYFSRPGSTYKYCLIVLNEAEKKVEIYSYGKRDLLNALHTYSEFEKEIASGKGLDAVFVSVKSLRQLKRAYPNYFLDTRMFLDLVKAAIR